MTLIECRGLARTYRRGSEEITPLEDLDLDIEAGQFVALMGPSGSGKTTLLNLLAGIDRPTRGTLVIDGREVHRLSGGALARWRAEAVGYVFQLYNLVPVLTAYENVELPLLLHGLSRKERHRRVAAALDLVGIADRMDHRPNQLSGGQEQRVAIARSIVTDPTLILADEPTGDLDRESATRIMELLSRLNRDLGRTVVMVTHDPKTTAWCDTLLHLEKGRLVEADATEEVT
ncbi:MAG: ABC transporter ATP-binding protein [Phycisphaerae bacterium]|nr:ABC transporter ATP-binding protein [Phycisphaerae bacterium]